MQLAGPGPSGYIASSWPLYPAFWNDIAGIWQLTSPRDLLPGALVGIRLYAVHNGAVRQRMQFLVVLYGPNDVFFALNTVEDTGNPGMVLVNEVTGVTAIGGIYYAKAWLYGEELA